MRQRVLHNLRRMETEGEQPPEDSIYALWEAEADYGNGERQTIYLDREDYTEYLLIEKLRSLGAYTEEVHRLLFDHISAVRQHTLLTEGEL